MFMRVRGFALAVVAAGLVVADGRAIRCWAAGLLVAAAHTQIVFPLTYGAIATGTGPPLWVPVLALAGRERRGFSAGAADGRLRRPCVRLTTFLPSAHALRAAWEPPSARD